MKRVPLESSAVRTAGYDEATLTLELEFTSGRIYQFEGVPASVYAWLVRTDSKGSYVTRMINPRYTSREITPERANATEPDDLVRRLEDSLRWLDRKPR